MAQRHVLPEELTQEQAEFIASTFNALSDPTRMRIIFRLIKQETNVSCLAEELDLSISAVSHHLAKLRDRRLVVSRREGNQVFYTIDDNHIGFMISEALSHLDHQREGLPQSLSTRR